MPLTLELAQTVAIGAFNPYVITPDWLVRFGGYPGKNECTVRLVPLGGGAAFDFEFEEKRVQWEVDHQRLSVASSAPYVDCGSAVSEVLALLPHTPVQAMGHNFHFTASKEEWGNGPVPMLGNKRLEDFQEAEQVSWAGMFRQDDARIEITLAYEAGAVAILLNHHRTMNAELARKAKTAGEQIAQARKAAEKFLDDFKVSRELLSSLFEVELSR